MVGIFRLLVMGLVMASVLQVYPIDTDLTRDFSIDWKDYEYDLYDSTAEEIAAIMAMVGFIILLIIVVIWIILAVFVYKDAERRGAEHPGLWALLVLFTGIIGLIIWFILRPNRKCPHCGSTISAKAIVCPICGKKFREV